MTTRILVVANRTAATHRLLDEVARRSAQGPCEFSLLVPATPGSRPDWTLENALPLLSRAARRPVDGIEGGDDALEAVREAIAGRGFDEVIVSTLAPRLSRWLRTDLPRRIAALGLPVTVVTPRKPPQTLMGTAEMAIYPEAGVRAEKETGRDWLDPPSTGRDN